MDKEKYSLYTEKIIQKPAQKYRGLFKLVRLLVSAAVFGIVSCVTFVFLYPWVSGLFIKEKNETRADIVIEKDEYPTQSQPADQEETQTSQGEPADSPSEMNVPPEENISRVMENIRRTVVKINAVDSGQQELFTDNVCAYGVIFAEVDNEYLILTQYGETAKSEQIAVEFGNGEAVSGFLIKGDERFDMAIVCVRENDMRGSLREYLLVAGLGNSYQVRLGEGVYTAGRIFSTDFSVNTGITTNVAHMAGMTDTYVGLLNTNMQMQSGDTGFLFDDRGNVLGIPFQEAGTDTFTFYGISDLKFIIEALSNGIKPVYCGIIGEDVTADMAALYHLPMGVYITEVVVDSPAYQAGLQAGDVITSVNDESVLTFSAFSEKIYKLKGGDKATINVQRLGKDEYKDILFSVTLEN